MIYRVDVTETRRRSVAVEASSPSEARSRVSDAWHKCEVVLENEDFDGVEFHVSGEIDAIIGKQEVERKDV